MDVVDVRVDRVVIARIGRIRIWFCGEKMEFSMGRSMRHSKEHSCTGGDLRHDTLEQPGLPKRPLEGLARELTCSPPR